MKSFGHGLNEPKAQGTEKASFFGVSSLSSTLVFGQIIDVERCRPTAPQRRPRPTAVPRLLRNRKLVIGGSGLALGFLGYRYYGKASSAPEDNPPQDFDFSTRYNATASTFDQDVDTVEWLYGITKLRKRLIQQAHGNVFEAAVGTGRNSDFYDLKNITSLTFLDQSEEMVELAKAKWRATHPEYADCRFITGSGLEPIPSPPGGDDGAAKTGYDTIVATISLCSTPGPSIFLRNLAAQLSYQDEPRQATSAASQQQSSGPLPARILLLEHGRSYYSWLNKLLDSTAPAHAKQHGCWWNRDIGKIVEDSGLEIIRTERNHLGTTWTLELGLPTEAKGAGRRQWLEATRRMIASLETEQREHEEWRERMRLQDEVRRQDAELEAWRIEQRERMKKQES